MGASFNPIERTISQALSKFPFLKMKIKRLYSILQYILHRKKSQFSSISAIECYSDVNCESFFGYYDKSPMSQDGYVLCHLTDYSTSRYPSSEKQIYLALFSPDDSKKPLLKIKVGAYNWQQGTKAHWLDNDLFIFNDYDYASRMYISCVYSCRTLSEVKRFNMPVQDSYYDKYFLSLNYRRLNSMRPDYGYRNLPNMNAQELGMTDNDGIWKIDYQSGQSELLISLTEVKSFESESFDASATHKVNHIMISPDGQKFIFIHRYFINKRRYDRLFIYDFDLKTLRLLCSSGMVSHCFWYGSGTIFGYLRSENGEDGFWLIDVDTISYRKFDNSSLNTNGDGHPHVFGDTFVVDTYPDKARMQHLMVGNLQTGKITEVGSFFHGFKFDGETRCDLHPRFSADGKYIFFDSVFSGCRNMYRMRSLK